MSAFRFIALTLVAAAALSFATAQERKVEVVGLQSRDLERTAYHLGVTMEQVGQIRELIQKATDLALESELDSSWSLFQLAWLWRRAHPTKALAAIDRLLDKLKSTAAQTSEPAVYRWCTSEAGHLTHSLFQDDRRLADFFDDWPQRPDFGEESQSNLATITEQVRAQRVQQTAKEDPAAAAQLLRSSPDGLASHLALDIAQRLDREGQTEAAGRLIQEALAQFRDAPDSPENTSRFLGFLRGLGIWFPDHFIPALRIFISRERSLPSRGSNAAIRLEGRNGFVQLSPAEAMVFNTLRSLVASPATLPEALEVLPQLRAKLDQVGGFDQAIRADMVHKDESGQEQRRNFFDKGFVGFVYRWGEAAERPSEVRRRLRALMIPGQEWQLSSVVNSYCAQDPAFSRIGLEVLGEFAKDDDPEGRLRWFPHLMDTHRQCEGKVDRALIEEGFRLLDEVPAPKRDSLPAVMVWREPDLEHRLLVEWSRLDFDAASEHVRQLEQPAERFKLYVAMAEGRVAR